MEQLTACRHCNKTDHIHLFCPMKLKMRQAVKQGFYPDEYLTDHIVTEWIG